MCCNISSVTSATNPTVSYHTPFDCNSEDSTENIMSYETYRAIEKATHCAVVPCLFVLGAPTNIVSMIIFYRQGLRDRMNLCLFCLAFVDFLFGTSVFVEESYCLIALVFPDKEQLLKVTFTKYSLYFIFGFQHSSSCLTMIIAAERCVCVMFPMKAATLISTKTMVSMLIATFSLLQLLNSVYIVKEEVTSVKDDVTGEDNIILKTTEVFLRYSFLGIIENIVLPFISLISFAVVFVATTMTVVRLQTALTWRKSTASGNSHRRNQAVLMRMLVMVSCLYILCTAPSIALALTRFLVHEFRSDGRFQNLFFAIHALGAAIIMFNSSVNFFIYVFMSSRFRHELISFIRCGRTSLVERCNVANINIVVQSA